MLLYTLLQILALPFFILSALYRLATGRLSLAEIRERIHDALGSKRALTEKESILLHASSVGEAKIAILVANEIRKRGKTHISLTISTPTGKKIAVDSDSFDSVYYFPFDLPYLTKRLIDRINPVKAFIIETEMWPRFFLELSKRCPVYVVNGRLSDRSFKRYLLFDFFLRRFFALVDFYFARTELDFERAKKLGVKAGQPYGNIKYSYPDRKLPYLEKRIHGILGKKIIIFGSIRGREEPDVVQAVKYLSQRHRDSVFIIAPRHIDRVENIKRLLSENSLDFGLFSQDPGKNILILDEMGLLFALYRYSYLAFIGGSLYPYGGQNPMEPAFFGKPVIFGKYMENFMEEKKIMLENNAVRIVAGPEKLAETIEELLSDEKAAKALGLAAASCYARVRCDIGGILTKTGL